MTIGVSFHHGHHLYVRSDHVLNRSKIIGNLFERNLHPGSKSKRPHGSSRAAAVGATRTDRSLPPSYSVRRRAPSPAVPILSALVLAFRGPASAYHPDPKLQTESRSRRPPRRSPECSEITPERRGPSLRSKPDVCHRPRSRGCKRSSVTEVRDSPGHRSGPG